MAGASSGPRSSPHLRTHTPFLKLRGDCRWRDAWKLSRDGMSRLLFDCPPSKGENGARRCCRGFGSSLGSGAFQQAKAAENRALGRPRPRQQSQLRRRARSESLLILKTPRKTAPPEKSNRQLHFPILTWRRWLNLLIIRMLFFFKPSTFFFPPYYIHLITSSHCTSQGSDFILCIFVNSLTPDLWYGRWETEGQTERQTSRMSAHKWEKSREKWRKKRKGGRKGGRRKGRKREKNVGCSETTNRVFWNVLNPCSLFLLKWFLLPASLTLQKFWNTCSGT